MASEQPSAAELIALALIADLTQRVMQIRGSGQTLQRAWFEGLNAMIGVLGWAMVRFADAESGGVFAEGKFVEDSYREEIWGQFEIRLRAAVPAIFEEVLGYDPTLTEEGTA
jgi:hypothetical protein